MIAIDLGSNTLSAVLMDCNNLERIKDIQKIVRTAQDLQKNRIISKEAVKRVIKALKEIQKEIDFSNQNIKAVATAALRMAKNKNEVLEEIEEKTNIRFEIIDGEKEAYLTALAVKERLKKLNFQFESFINIDLGGGSTEIILNYPDKIFSKSVDIGIVTFAEKHKSFEKIKQEAKTAYKGLKDFIKEHYESYKKPSILTATAGTPTTIASFLKGMDYENYNYKKINGMKISIEDIKISLERLLKLNKKEREKWVGVGRGDLIIAGIYLLISLIEITSFKKITVIDDSLKEGAAILGCKSKFK